MGCPTGFCSHRLKTQIKLVERPEVVEGVVGRGQDVECVGAVQSGNYIEYEDIASLIGYDQGMHATHVAIARVSLVTIMMVTAGCAPTTVITQRVFRVERVIDGDTLVVRYDGESTSVRLWGIDTPERGEPGADEATEALKKRVADCRGVIRIRFIPSEHKRDHFGRLLALIECADQNNAVKPTSASAPAGGGCDIF